MAETAVARESPEIEIRERARASKAERVTAEKAGGESGAESETDDRTAREIREAERPKRETMAGKAMTLGEARTAREIRWAKRPKREVMTGKIMTLGGPGKTERDMKAGEARMQREVKEAETPGEARTAREIREAKRPKRETMVGKAMTQGGPGKTERETKAGEARTQRQAKTPKRQKEAEKGMKAGEAKTMETGEVKTRRKPREAERQTIAKKAEATTLIKLVSARMLMNTTQVLERSTQEVRYRTSMHNADGKIGWK